MTIIRQNYTTRILQEEQLKRTDLRLKVTQGSLAFVSNTSAKST